MLISCSLDRFLGICRSLDFDVVRDVVHIPTDRPEPLSMRVEQSHDGVLVHFTRSSSIIVNVLAYIQHQLGVPAPFLPTNAPAPLVCNTDMYYDTSKLRTHPYVMFKAVPWLNRPITDSDVRYVCEACTHETRLHMLLLARMVGFGGRLSSLNHLRSILDHDITPQMERLIEHILRVHGEPLTIYEIPDRPVLDGDGTQEEMKTEPGPPQHAILLRGLQTVLPGMSRSVRQRVESLLTRLDISHTRWDDWIIRTPTLKIKFHQRMPGYIIVHVDPLYDDEVTLTQVWKYLRRL